MAVRAARARGRRRAEVRAIAAARAALVRNPVPLATVANIATPRKPFTFTDAQIAIAMAVHAQQLTKAS